jgi:phenylpyruvate tautomerase PptA (4-oxalocrotonate tautomerase family)
MPHISKEKMDEEVQEKFFRELTQLIAKTTNKDSYAVIDGL